MEAVRTPKPLIIFLGILCWVGQGTTRAQGPRPVHPSVTSGPIHTVTGLAVPAAEDRPLTINLATALQLGDARALDIAVAAARARSAAAELERANVLWLPTLFLGVDYARHDGQIQDIQGTVFGASRSSFLVGAGPSATFAVTDAIFEPLAARQVLRARDAATAAARNDNLVAVTDAFFAVQQARGELAAAVEVVARMEEVVGKVEKLSPGLVTPVEPVRARAELARRRLAVTAARERWRLASADLARVLRLDAAGLFVPLEAPNLKITLIEPDRPVDDLILLALANRPELASQQALVQATVERLRQERLRPLIPSVLLRGASTNPGGTLGAGYFGGGRNGYMGNFGPRMDFDVQVVWEWQNLGFGNKARVKRVQAENEVTLLELFRLQDRIAAEVAQAHASIRSAADRIVDAELGLKDALDSAAKNLEALNQFRRVGEVNLMVVRPQEAIAAVQALNLAYQDYFAAVADYDRAQFRLYRAMGNTGILTDCPVTLPEPVAVETGRATLGLPFDPAFPPLEIRE